MIEKTVQHVLDSTLDSVAFVENLAYEIAQRAGFCDASLEQISLAVHEITANAVIHGNQYSAAKKVFVAISMNEDRITITIGDEGAGLDPETIPDPLAPLGLLRQSGRGLYLSRVLMDEHHIEARNGGGTQITLTKYFQRTEVPLTTTSSRPKV
jgi:serine/threonine-protein kinase RsbW